MALVMAEQARWPPLHDIAENGGLPSRDLHMCLVLALKVGVTSDIEAFTVHLTNASHFHVSDDKVVVTYSKGYRCGENKTASSVIELTCAKTVGRPAFER